MDNPVFEKRVELAFVDNDGETAYVDKTIRLSQQEINYILDGLATLPYRTDAVIAKILEAKKWLK